MESPNAITAGTILTPATLDSLTNAEAAADEQWISNRTIKETMNAIVALIKKLVC